LVWYTTFCISDPCGYCVKEICTANARLLGSRQIDAFRSHSHGLTAGPNNLQTSATPNANDVGRSGVTETGGSTQISGGTETRPLNTAYPPRIHA
jgi:hypothetical protein